MRNIHLAPIVAASLVAPITFATWTVSEGRNDQFHPGSREVHVLPALQPVEETMSVAPRRDPSHSADEADMVEWAYDRFALVDLEVPRVDIRFYDDTGPCNWNDGRFRTWGEHREISVCVPDLGTAASQLQRRRTLIHELAHAWDHANLDDDDRSGLLAIVDATDWYAPDSEWHERGVERLAETIAWGLYDQLRRPVRIDVPCRELHADFRAITGADPPGPLEASCA